MISLSAAFLAVMVTSRASVAESIESVFHCDANRPVVSHSGIAAPRLGDVTLGGVDGNAMTRCLESRAYSEWARGPMYAECADAFRTGWDDHNHGWQNEYWGKTMLCFSGACGYTHDPVLKAWTISRVHKFLNDYQKPNGYICTYSDEDCLSEGFSVWGRKYTLWALVDLYRTTGDAACLTAAEKLFDHLLAQLDRTKRQIWETGIWHGISSMSILKPVLELYELTGKDKFLRFAEKIIAALWNPDLKEGALLANAKRSENICTWFPKAAYWAKAYEIMSCLEGVVYHYRLTGDRKSLEGVLAFYAHLEREEINPMRSAGFFDHFLNAADQLNGMTELCDVTHWIRLNRELFLATGEAKYGDRIEEAFYNAFLAGVSRDGRWGAHIIRSHGSRHLWAPPQTGMFHHQCCPDNMMRTYFDMAGSVAAEENGTLSVLLYGDANARVGDSSVAISGGYPYADSPVVVRIRRKKEGVVRFRVPSWCRTFRVGGEVVPVRDGWYVAQAPSGESAWSLSFDFSPRVVAAQRRWGKPLPPSPQPHSLEIGGYTVHFMEWYTPEMAGLSRIEPAVTVMRGPLVLAKGRVAGTTRGETLTTFPYENGGEGWNATLEPAPPAASCAGAAQVWLLTLSRGIEKKTIPVSDFASVSNLDDPDNWFSLWF